MNVKYRVLQGIRSKHLFYGFQIFDRNSRNAFIGYKYTGNLQIIVQNKEIGIARLLNKDVEPRCIINMPYLFGSTSKSMFKSFIH